jgi:hypothetical protein
MPNQLDLRATSYYPPSMSKRAGVWWKRTKFTPQLTKAFPARRTTPPSDARHPESSKPRTGRHAELRLPACETRASESAASRPHFVGIEFAAHVGHVPTDQPSLAYVHDPSHQTFRHWMAFDGQLAVAHQGEK